MQKENRRRLSLEMLEGRDVPSTTPVVNLTAGTLTVQGTATNDNLQVLDTSGTLRIYVNGLLKGSFAGSAVQRIVLEGGAGNDILVANVTRQTVYLFGGMGSDRIWGGYGITYFSGGTGTNHLFRRGTANFFITNGGNDTISGTAGTLCWLNNRQAAIYNMTTMEREVVRLVNLERQKVGLSNLSINSTLAAAAQLQSAQMAANSKTLGASAAMKHMVYGSTTPSMVSRLEYVGYGAWSCVAENIAYGYASASTVVRAWMNSDPHRASILNPAFKEIGVSAVAGVNGWLFWTQSFAAR
jgi:uncharacterized protein YkwD